MKLFLLGLIITASSLTYNLKQDTKLEESIQRGSEVYADFCMTCHLPNGKGVKRMYPPLAKSDYLIENQEESIKAIKYGLTGSITVNDTIYNNTMTPQGLSDAEVADVMNYINNSWGNENKKMVTKEAVAKIKK